MNQLAQFPDRVLDRVYFDNSVRSWLVALAVLLAALAVLYLAKRVVGRRLRAAAERTATTVDDIAVYLVGRTKFFFVLAIAVDIAQRALDLPARVREAVHDVTTIAVALQLLFWANAAMEVAVRRYRARHGATGAGEATLTVLGYVGRLVLWVIVLLVALDNLGINITALVTGLGIGGIAIALAVQNILGDLFGALSIVLDRPFVVGDYIALDNGYDGEVEHIGLKTTRLRALSGEQVVVSNADLLKTRVRNFKRMTQRRVVFDLLVDVNTTADTAATVPDTLRSIVEAQPGLRFDRSHLKRLGDAGLVYETVYFLDTADYDQHMKAQQGVQLAILRRFATQGIALGTPTRAVTVRVQPGAEGDGAAGATGAAAGIITAGAAAAAGGRGP